jgi:hypothetical protein
MLNETQTHRHIHYFKQMIQSNVLKAELEIKPIIPSNYSSISSSDPTVIELNN